MESTPALRPLRSHAVVLGACAALILLTHFSIGNGYGFHRDELQFLDNARHLDWGFVAYPPLTAFCAPYNMQVRLLSQRLPGAKVGSVEKFQGQEAPVVIYSMSASSAEESTRGIDFLFSRNRTNVAISRAKTLAIVVGCPGLTPDGMRQHRADETRQSALQDSKG